MLQLTNVSKIYHVGDESIPALKNINLEIDDGEFVAIEGPSGSGKSTLLHLIGGLDTPTSGEIKVNRKIINGLKDRELSKYRNREIGFVFQDFQLQPGLNVLENVEVPLMFATGRKRREATIEKKSRELLKNVGLEDRLAHRPTEISGGQKQRAAIARALVNKPKILLADEPTGNLDSVTGRAIIGLLRHLHAKEKTTMVIVTHDRDIAKYADRMIHIRDGQIIK
jgi:putative ABC transport system ATP-binding protein